MAYPERYVSKAIEIVEIQVGGESWSAGSVCRFIGTDLTGLATVNAP
jgi:hypothetical protein